MAEQTPEQPTAVNPIIQWFSDLFLKHFATMLDARVAAMLAPAIAVLSTDIPLLTTLGNAVAIAVILAAVVLIVRKIYFPYLDAEEAINEAVRKGNLAAALVLFSVVILMCMIMYTFTFWASGGMGGHG